MALCALSHDRYWALVVHPLLTSCPLSRLAGLTRCALLLLIGAKAVVVTLGSRGCMLVSSSSEGYRQFAAERVDAIDTVGAGDAFLGSLGAYLARGAILEDALRNAVR